MDNIVNDNKSNNDHGPLAEALLCHIQEYYTKDLRNRNNGTTYKEATSEDDNEG